MEIILQVGVKAFLKNTRGEYLVIKRSSKKYPNALGKWDIVGGRINPGTKLLDNLAREIDEETGLKIIGEPKLVAAQDILNVPGKHIVRLTYVCIADGEVKLDIEEHDEFRWLTKQELQKMEDFDVYAKELVTEEI